MAADFEFEATPSLNNGTVQWQLCYKDPQGDQCGNSNANYPDVTVPRDSLNQTFQFKIVGDQTRLGIQFADNPILVEQDGSPTGPGVGQITGVALSSGGSGPAKTVLKFVDLNTLPNPMDPTDVVLKYQLNFKDAQGNAVTSIDPDITNGGKTFYGITDMTYVLVGTILVAALLAWAISSFVAKRTVRTMMAKGDVKSKPAG